MKNTVIFIKQSSLFSRSFNRTSGVSSKKSLCPFNPDIKENKTFQSSIYYPITGSYNGPSLDDNIIQLETSVTYEDPDLTCDVDTNISGLVRGKCRTPIFGSSSSSSSSSANLSSSSSSSTNLSSSSSSANSSSSSSSSEPLPIYACGFDNTNVNGQYLYDPVLNEDPTIDSRFTIYGIYKNSNDYYLFRDTGVDPSMSYITNSSIYILTNGEVGDII